MQRFCALLILLYSCLFAFSAVDSNFIDVSRLKYSSEFEKKQFAGLTKANSFAPLNFLFCLDSTTNETKAEKLKQKLNGFLNDKLSSAIGNKNPEKAVKVIFKEIHENLLSKYVLESRFERTLDLGEYNCVTASALYALAFEKFNIPYQIRSTTNHVYVIANPGPNQLLIETTDPVGGPFSYNEQYKKTYIEMLVQQKMISKQEYNTIPLEDLFQKHFYTSDTIDLKQLIGYHYYNDGVWLTTKEDYDGACNQLMKAYYLNKNKQIEHMLYLTLAVQVNKTFDVTDSASIDMFFLFSRLSGETDYEYLYNKYVMSAEDLLVRKDDLEKFKTSSEYILKFVRDSVQLSKFKEHYYFASAYSYYTKKDFISAYQNIVQSYCLNNKNIRVKALFEDLDKHLLNYLAESLDDDDEDGSSLDSLVNKLEKSLPVCEGANPGKWKFQMMMFKAALAFDDSEIEKGNKALNEAEKYAAENKLKDFEDRYVQAGYGSAKRHYYIQYNVSKAKEYVLRGLKLDPDNKMLKEDLETLNEMGDVKKPVTLYNYSPPPAKNYSKPAPKTVIVKTPH